MLAWGDLWAALCLVAVIEGLFLLLAPSGWRQAVQQLAAQPDGRIRRIGAVIVVLGLISLLMVRGG